jgi:hypothetical protein
MSVFPQCYWPHVIRRSRCKSHDSKGALTIAQQKKYGIHNRKSRLWIKRISQKETEIKVKGKKEKRGTTWNGSVTNRRICEVMMGDKAVGKEVRYHLSVCSLERFLCPFATFHCLLFVTIKPDFFLNLSLAFVLQPPLDSLPFLTKFRRNSAFSASGLFPLISGIFFTPWSILTNEIGSITL